MVNNNDLYLIGTNYEILNVRLIGSQEWAWLYNYIHILIYIVLVVICYIDEWEITDFSFACKLLFYF